MSWCVLMMYVGVVVLLAVGVAGSYHAYALGIAEGWHGVGVLVCPCRVLSVLCVWYYVWCL